MKYTVQQLEDLYDLSLNYTVEFDLTIDSSDYSTPEEYAEALMESVVIIPNEWVAHTEINLD